MPLQSHYYEWESLNFPELLSCSHVSKKTKSWQILWSICNAASVVDCKFVEMYEITTFLSV